MNIVTRDDNGTIRGVVGITASEYRDFAFNGVPAEEVWPHRPAHELMILNKWKARALSRDVPAAVEEVA